MEPGSSVCKKDIDTCKPSECESKCCSIDATCSPTGNSTMPMRVVRFLQDPPPGGTGEETLPTPPEVQPESGEEPLPEYQELGPDDIIDENVIGEDEKMPPDLVGEDDYDNFPE